MKTLCVTDDNMSNKHTDRQTDGQQQLQWINASPLPQGHLVGQIRLTGTELQIPMSDDNTQVDMVCVDTTTQQ